MMLVCPWLIPMLLMAPNEVVVIIQNGARVIQTNIAGMHTIA